jgi:hypothetical protein
VPWTDRDHGNDILHSIKSLSTNVFSSPSPFGRGLGEGLMLGQFFPSRVGEMISLQERNHLA